MIGNTPDGVTVVPWKNGKLLVWDVTCPDTFAPVIATGEAGAVAVMAEERKYSYLDSYHSFMPVAIGVFGPQTIDILHYAQTRVNYLCCYYWLVIR